MRAQAQILTQSKVELTESLSLWTLGLQQGLLFRFSFQRFNLAEYRAAQS
jgi:hypothetical protein